MNEEKMVNDVWFDSFDEFGWERVESVEIG